MSASPMASETTLDDLERFEIHDMAITSVVIEPERVLVHVRSATVLRGDEPEEDHVRASFTLACSGVRSALVVGWVTSDTAYNGRITLADGTAVENLIEPWRLGSGPAPVRAIWVGLTQRNGALEIECSHLELRDVVVSGR